MISGPSLNTYPLFFAKKASTIGKMRFEVKRKITPGKELCFGFTT
jgi:hypothetical protein